MLTRLAAASRVHQSIAHSDGLELISIGRGDSRYLAYLVKRYGFEAPLESALAVTPGIAGVIELHPRRQSRMIVDDLVALGMPLARVLEIPHAHVCAFRDLRDALGWLYVSDRSAATHDVVAREVVRKMPNLAPVVRWSAAHDLLGGRDAVGRALDAVAVTSQDERRIIDAAVQAFEHQHSWLRAGGVRVLGDRNDGAPMRTLVR